VSSETCVPGAQADGSALPLILMTEGKTDTLRFDGRQGLGLRFSLRTHGRVVGEPGWNFRFDEYVSISLSRRGVSNWGVMTVDTPDGTFLVRFEGRVQGVRLMVRGRCWAEGASGRFAGARRSGLYAGFARLRFGVIYSFR
jgi:hypothetical protein